MRLSNILTLRNRLGEVENGKKVFHIDHCLSTTSVGRIFLVIMLMMIRSAEVPLGEEVKNGGSKLRVPEIKEKQTNLDTGCETEPLWGAVKN